eukprot:EG_transcript_71487
MADRCLTESPVVEVVGLNCLQTAAPNCQCGADPRCLSWYQPLVNATSTCPAPSGAISLHSACVLPRLTTPCRQSQLLVAEPNMNTFMPLLDFTATPAKFL